MSVDVLPDLPRVRIANRLSAEYAPYTVGQAVAIRRAVRHIARRRLSQIEMRPLLMRLINAALASEFLKRDPGKPREQHPAVAFLRVLDGVLHDLFQRDRHTASRKTGTGGPWAAESRWPTSQTMTKGGGSCAAGSRRT